MNRSEILERIQRAGSDEHTVFGGAYTGGYYMQQQPECLADLVECLLPLSPFKNYVAIGIAAGGTERFLSETLGVRTLSIIDDGLHHNHSFWHQNKKALERQSVAVREMISGSQNAVVEEWLNTLWIDHGIKYDLASIDGDHSNGAPLRDFHLIKGFMNPGALVWFHDVNIKDLDCKNAFEEASKSHEVVLHTKGRMGIGVVRV